MNTLILNSAHGKYPLGNDSWIQATVKTVSKITGSTDTIICSLDPMPWSLVTYLAGRHGMNISLIIPASAGCDRQARFASILEDYHLDKLKVFPPLYLDESEIRTENVLNRKRSEHKAFCSQTKTLWQLRDRVAAETAEIIYPVSIRPGGRLSQLMQEKAIRPKLRDDFRIDFKASEGFIPCYDFAGKAIVPLPEGEWLVHWTRSSQGPWPGEKAWQFYHDMLENPGEYVRNASATLVRIVAENCLRGSSWKLPRGERAIAFTELPVEETLPLMRWRQRFVRYTFEPYGIAIRRSALIDLGARQVLYSKFQVSGFRYQVSNTGFQVPDSGQNPYLSGEDQLFIHAAGEKTDWTREKEWRFRGDLSLNTIDSRDMLLLVPDNKDREVMLRRIARDISVHVIFRE